MHGTLRRQSPLRLMYVCERLDCGKARNANDPKNCLPPRGKTSSELSKMSKSKRQKVNKIFSLMNASVKENSPPERDFSATLQNSAHDSQKIVRKFRERSSQRSLDLSLLTGLRNECFGRIEKAAAPKCLIRKSARLPLLQNRQSRRRHSAIFCIENNHYSNRFTWGLR